MNTLFYSPKCKHCENIISTINSNFHLKNTFNIENIHTSKHNLLKQLQSVPTIYITDSNKFIVGKNAFEFVQNELDLHLNAFEQHNSFSFIENPNDLLNSDANFVYLTEDGGYNVPNTNNNNNNNSTSSKEKEQNSKYEEFLNNRNNELPTLIKRV